VAGAAPGPGPDADRTVRVLDDSPSLGSLYVRAALTSIPGAGRLPGIDVPTSRQDSVPALRLALPGITPDRGHVDAYREVCRLPAHEGLPATYPHLLAFPLHLTLMTDPAFPFAPMGAVHVSNRIEQRQPVGIGGQFDLAVWAEDLRPHRRGRTVTLVSEVSVRDQVVWRDETVLLSRRHGDESENVEDVHRDLPEEPPTGPVQWSLPGNLSRRYAAVSGDRNPIHLYDVTAMAFGFRKHIAHGMWTKARCLAELDNRLPEAYAVEVVFRKPIELPGRVSFGARRRDGHLDFGVQSDSGRAHLTGRIRPL
jgi:acyl dehydratase